MADAGSGGFKERLGQMQQNWQTSREEKGGGFNDAFEEGVYAFKLQGLYLAESSGAQELMARAEHYCLEGTPAGEVYQQFFNLEKANAEGKIWGQIFLCQLIEALGYEAPENMEDLEEVLAQIQEAAPSYTARVKINKQGYSNLTIQRITDEGGGGGAAEPAPKPAPARGRAAAAPEPEEEPAAEAEGEAGEGEAPAEEQDPALTSFIEAWEIDLGGATTKEEIATALAGYEWKAADLTPEELGVLKGYNVPVKGVAAPKAAPPKPAPKAPPKAPPKAAAPAKPAPKAPAKPAPRGVAKPAGRR